MRKFILTFDDDSEYVRLHLVNALATRFNGSELTLFEETETTVESVYVPNHPSEEILRLLDAELRKNGGLLARQWSQRIKELRDAYVSSE